jgi:hypothetical protein
MVILELVYYTSEKRFTTTYKNNCGLLLDQRSLRVCKV